jgi:hypothetical protein
MRFGPLLVALAGAVLIALELLRPRDEGPSLFWMSVGALALVLGIVGHLQPDQKPPQPPLPRL